MAAAGLFGALGALGDFGNQRADAQQQAHEEIVQRMLEPLKTQQLKLGNQELVQRLADQKQLTADRQQQQQIARQPAPIGNPYVGADGKQYQYVLDPLTGGLTTKELTAPLPETKEQTEARGLKSQGWTDDEIKQAILQRLQGKIAEKREVVTDPNSPTGATANYYDAYGQFIWSAPTTPSRTMVPRVTDRTGIDQFGNQTTTHTVTRPMLPSGAYGLPGGAGVPSGAPGGQGGAVAPQAAPVYRPIPGETGAIPGGTGTGPIRGPGGAGAPAAITPQGGLSVGTYKGLDANGNIPPRPGLNDQTRQFANDILNGRDANKIPGKARAEAERIAGLYGWRGQGSLTPPQQMQIEQVDNSLNALSKMTGVFNSFGGRAFMSTIPTESTDQGGTTGFAAQLGRTAMSQPQREYVNALTRLRSVITGIRGFTGANNSNATAQRMLDELPNFTNTASAADAKDKIDKLRTEVQIIKRLGYFLPEGDPRLPQQSDATTKAAPAAGSSAPGAAKQGKVTTPSASDPAGIL